MSRPVVVSYRFRLAALWNRLTKGPKGSALHISFVVLGGISLYLAQHRIASNIDRSSLLVRQTLFTIRSTPQLAEILGSDLRVVTDLEGYQSQKQQRADVSFQVLGSKSNIA